MTAVRFFNPNKYKISQALLEKETKNALITGRDKEDIAPGNLVRNKTTESVENIMVDGRTKPRIFQ